MQYCTITYSNTATVAYSAAFTTNKQDTAAEKKEKTYLTCWSYREFHIACARVTKQLQEDFNLFLHMGNELKKSCCLKVQQ